MHKWSFEFNDVDMFAVYGLRIRKRSRPLMPALREQKMTVPGRSGAYDFTEGLYDEQKLLVECDTIKTLTASDKRELAYLMSHKGRLRFWDEPDKHYKARIYDTSALEKVGGIGTYIPLTFICEPFAYGKTVSVAVPRPGILVPEYRGTAETPTRIEIINTGTDPVSGIQITIRKRRS